MFDHFQFTLIDGPNIPGSYAILFFIASDFTSVTSHIHNWALFLLWLCLFIFLELFCHSSPVTYWASTNLGSSSFTAISFYLLIWLIGFSRQEYWNGLPFLSPVNHSLSFGSYFVHWIIEKPAEFQKHIIFCFIDYAKAFDCLDHNKLWKILKKMGIKGKYS